MQAYFVLVIFTTTGSGDAQVYHLRNTLKKYGLEETILGCDERNYTLSNTNILVGEFMAASAEECRQILYTKVAHAFRDVQIGGRFTVGVCHRAEWTVRDVLPQPVYASGNEATLLPDNECYEKEEN